MPISHAQERRNAAKKLAKTGVVVEPCGKKANGKEEKQATCALCSHPIRVTKRNVEMKQHAEAKHPKEQVATCWPGQTIE